MPSIDHVPVIFVLLLTLVAFLTTAKDCPCSDCTLNNVKLKPGILVRSDEPFYADNYLTEEHELISNGSILLPLLLTIEGMMTGESLIKF